MENRAPKERQVEKLDIKVAVIGSGPAGLTCAGDLAKKVTGSLFLKRFTPRGSPDVWYP